MEFVYPVPGQNGLKQENPTDCGVKINNQL